MDWSEKGTTGIRNMPIEIYDMCDSDELDLLTRLMISVFLKKKSEKLFKATHTYRLITDTLKKRDRHVYVMFLIKNIKKKKKMISLFVSYISIK